MSRSSLYQVHSDAGATFGELHGWELPLRFSSIEEEYAAAKTGAALIDRSHLGRIKVTGEDSLDLLNRLSTNDVMGLAAGAGLSTVLTTNKGRVVDLLTVYCHGDELVVLTAPQNREKVPSWIDRFVFGEEVELQDVTDSLAMLTLLGPRATEILDDLTDLNVGDLDEHHGFQASVSGSEVYVARESRLWGQAYNILVEADSAAGVWDLLLEAGASQVGMEAYELLRIDSCVPQYGSELSEDYNPLEAKLDSSINFSKGCYVGQEVVARLNTYEKVKRYLVKLQFDNGTAPQPGTALLAGEKEVGAVTSITTTPGNGMSIALAYVRKAHVQPGTTLTANSSTGRVVA
jgi:glycine cleavage system T protein